MNLNHIVQIIRSNNLFVVHEYLFGVKQKSGFQDIANLNRTLICLAPHYHKLATIYGSDKTVRDAADY